MGRGRPKLTQRNKLNRKLDRLLKEIEEIKKKLAERLIDDLPEENTKKEE